MPGLKLVGGFKGLSAEPIAIAWSQDGRALAATGQAGAVGVWLETAGGRPWLLQGHDTSKYVLGVAWHPSGPVLATAGHDGTVRLWDMDSGESRVLCTLDSRARGVAWSPDGRRLAVSDGDGGIGIWDVEDSVLVRHARVHDSYVTRPCWSPDGQVLVSGSYNGIINLQTSLDLQPLRTLSGHAARVHDIGLSPDGRQIASASADRTVRVWNLARGMEMVILEGHTGPVMCVRFSPDGEFLASGSSDHTVRLWRCRDWECVAILPRGGFERAGGLDFHPHQPVLAAKDQASGQIDCWRIDFDLFRGASVGPGSRRYVNAKVVLLGDTGVGKSGLGLVLSGQPYQPTDSTHGRNVWPFDMYEVELSEGGQTREVLLWDLAGQPGYRLVHQLHLNEVAVALMVFDSRSETDPFAGVKHWVRALAQARRLEGDAAVPARIYLVAARADRGGVGVSKQRVDTILEELSGLPVVLSVTFGEPG